MKFDALQAQEVAFFKRWAQRVLNVKTVVQQERPTSLFFHARLQDIGLDGVNEGVIHCEQVSNNAYNFKWVP